MGKIEEAIKKINDEVQKNHNNINLVRIGEYIIDNITSEAVAEKILAEKKTLKGCHKNIRGKAAPSQIEGMAMIDDEMVFGWVREYFGLDKTEQKPHLEVVKTQTKAPAEQGTRSGFAKQSADNAVSEEPKKSRLSMADFF